MSENVKQGPALSVAAEEPRRPGMSAAAAKGVHRKRGYAVYQGPKLKGPRFRLDPASEAFPDALRRVPRPPAALYVIGSPSALQEGLAVVGARKATPYGRECAMRFATIAAEKGIVIISGGARGCDSAAHRAALHASSPTVVFLGGGCDQVYPAENYDLFQQVIDGGGAVVSEQEWGYPPLPHLFLERNRLIAGLAKATLIVEAGLPSGTFSTADEALSASREVLVVPGAITSASSRGANRLIYQGATPVVDDDSFEDVLFSVFGCLKQRRGEGSAVGPDSGMQSRDPLLAAVSARPTSLEELVALAGTPPAEFGSALAWVASKMEGYERSGSVLRLPDGRYAARVR